MSRPTIRSIAGVLLCLMAGLAVMAETLPEPRVLGPQEWREPLAARYHLRTRTSKFYKRAVRAKSAKA